MSWVKLEVIRDLVVGTKDGAERLDALVLAAVYLKVLCSMCITLFTLFDQIVNIWFYILF